MPSRSVPPFVSQLAQGESFQSAPTPEGSKSSNRLLTIPSAGRNGDQYRHRHTALGDDDSLTPGNLLQELRKTCPSFAGSHSDHIHFFLI